MLRNLEVQFFPSDRNCLAWSEDGLLAVAALQDLHVLIPNRHDEESASSAHGADQWNQIHLHVNIFTKQEWPLQELASSEEFSIGEEQSMSEIVSLNWSSSGLARHQRCLLAVLTSNLLLSIWDPGPDPSKARSWQRVLIINDYIGGETTTDRDLTLSIIRERKRIRAAKWSSIKDEQSKTHHFLSVVNDYQEVIFLRVRSNTNALNSYTKNLRVEAVHRTPRDFFEEDPHEIGSEDARPNRLRVTEIRNESALLALPNRGRVEHDISWSSWEHEDEQNSRFVSTIICRTNAKARRLELKFSIADGGPKLMVPTANYLNCTEGPVLWWELRDISRRPNKADTVVYGMREAIRVTIMNGSTDTADKKDWKFPLLTQINGRIYKNWAPISSMCVSNSDDTPLLCVATQQSDLVRLTVDQTPDHGPVIRVLDSDKPSNLENQMLSCKKAFASLYNLNINQTGINIRGLASWKNGWIAMCITLRATDRLAYTIRARERATLIFSHANLEDGPKPLPKSLPWQAPLPNYETQTVQSKVLDSILNWPTTKASIPDPLSRRILYNALCATMLSFTSHPLPNLPARWDAKILPSLRVLGELRPTRPKDRYTHSRYNMSLPPDDDDDDDEEGADENLASAFLADLAPTWKHGGGEMQDTNIREWLNNCIRSRSIDEKAMPVAERLVEACIVCRETLLWVSLEEAECTHGHTWERCAMTFLAIQEPGVSKHCERCNRQFINEEFLNPAAVAEDDVEGDDAMKDAEAKLEVEATEVVVAVEEDEKEAGEESEGEEREEEEEEPKTLAEDIFTRCSVCIFCGGKFVSEVTRGEGDEDGDGFAFLTD